MILRRQESLLALFCLSIVMSHISQASCFHVTQRYYLHAQYQHQQLPKKFQRGRFALLQHRMPSLEVLWKEDRLCDQYDENIQPLLLSNQSHTPSLEIKDQSASVEPFSWDD